ncbi:uracil-DNA glycosylase [Terriglobus sp. TAA 43]|uniref:uracil-DNA glycosylase n=1 Tax=Terriglobus sp. TAA 43 TaxID=278961 RepID=UPI000647761A|nr:uracil-DNA glycosylase [Terriglobus sp. TAA 43]
MDGSAESLRGYLEYLRDLGIYDVYRTSDPSDDPALAAWWKSVATPVTASAPATPQRPANSGSPSPQRPAAPVQRPAPTPTPQRPPMPSSNRAPDIVITPPTAAAAPHAYDFDQAPAPTGQLAPPAMPLVSFNNLAPLPTERVAPANKLAALQSVRDTIGDCTRCPLAYAGRHNIVFADGDPNAELMFVGEGPGADEDASGTPFVGKAGQLLNNMINAMGLKREHVYIANVVKCRPPQNRTPEPKEANTCSPFLLQQVDIVQPKVIVALGATAATYLLGVKQSLANLRGQWHDVRGAKCAVTYHPAFLLRDPRQKGEAWKDLQRVMVELGLKPPARS